MSSERERELLKALIACRARLAEWVDGGSTDDRDWEAVQQANKAIERWSNDPAAIQDNGADRSVAESPR